MTQFGVMDLFCHEDHLSDGIPIRNTVSDKDSRINSQNRCTAKVFKIEFFEIFIDNSPVSY